MFKCLNISISNFLLHINQLDVFDESSVPVEVRTSEGGSTTLECQTSGTPLPVVIWTKDGKEIKANEHFALESSPNAQVEQASS